jgi:light-regulated signal transduction histidine kinase (bacteriophytochrome)
MQMGVEIFFKEQKYFITSERQQILDLLLSTYETAVIKNHELKAVQDKLEALNEQLEKKVEERTAALLAEIEERKKAEEEIKRLNDGLEQRVAMRTQELEAANRELEAFAYSVSHDLRAPLRAIDGFARILREEHASGLDAEGDRVVAVIGKNARRMGQLIDDILAFSRIGRQEMRCTIVPMHNIAQEVYDELKGVEGERTILFTLAPLPPAHGDPALIRQVLHNLLGNSIKYTRPREIAEVEVGCRCGDGEHVYFVRDNGVGFDMKYAGKLFGVFQRLHEVEEFEGTGVGLAIAQRIVLRHGGRIWGEGKEGEGAAFYFTLPPACGDQ